MVAGSPSLKNFLAAPACQTCLYLIRGCAMASLLQPHSKSYVSFNLSAPLLYVLHGLSSIYIPEKAKTVSSSSIQSKSLPPLLDIPVLMCVFCSPLPAIQPSSKTRHTRYRPPNRISLIQTTTKILNFLKDILSSKPYQQAPPCPLKYQCPGVMMSSRDSNQWKVLRDAYHAVQQLQAQPYTAISAEKD